MKCLLIVLNFFFFSIAIARVRDFQTTRLISTGGAGVASILVNEAAILNPASTAFFQETTLSYQHQTTKIENKNDQRITDKRDVPAKDNHDAYFFFDNSSSTKGGFSYQTQRENQEQRKRFTATFAEAFSKGTSMGMTYRYTQDVFGYSDTNHKTMHQIVVGFTHIYSESLNIGMVVVDPYRSLRDDTNAIIGSQYQATEMLSLLFDVGANYTKDVKQYYLYRGAAQINIFTDFFARGGKFYDATTNIQGIAWGLSWVGPKLAVDLAFRNSKQIESDIDFLYKNEKIFDTSFSLSTFF